MNRHAAYMKNAGARSGNGTKGSEEILTGIVAASEWDEMNRIVAVSLYATDDDTYRIENSIRFIDLIEHTIEARGRVKRDRKNFKSIAIKKYRIIDAPLEANTQKRGK